jgi:acyl carrier protein phosphodiesterase
MNYLAHLYLSEPTPEAWLGSLVGDFMQGMELRSFPPAVQAGILQHRRVDRFTDQHPIVRRSKQRLEQRFSRYAGIMVDVFYDHFLARDWPAYRPGQSLGEFTAQVYRALQDQAGLLPRRLCRILPRMREQDWLGSYRDVAGIDLALRGLGRRLRRANPLAEGVGELVRNHDALAADFARFFPELRALRPA